MHSSVPLHYCCKVKGVVNAGLDDFLTTMNLLIKEPNIISPSILRAEVLSDDYTTNGHRVVTRLIVPRQKRGNFIWQKIEISQEEVEEGRRCVQVRHSAHNNNTFKEFAKATDLPYFYPKYASFTYQFIESAHSASEGVFSINVSSSVLEEIDEERMEWIWQKIFKHVSKIMVGTRLGYKKRVHHDVVIDKIAYQDRYQVLKDRYGPEWVAKWPDSTDPQKHVFEDIGIATWLILVWEEGEADSGQGRRKFVDLGCGNGFLTHILVSEGYQGVGIDMSARSLWKSFPKETQECLVERCIHPGQEDLSGFEYIIGNHSDELTPWIPLLALRDGCKWAVIPCCLFQLNGAKFTLNSPELGRYKTYCNFIQDYCKEMGWTKVEIEYLRIPSTKNACLLSRTLEQDAEKVERARKMIEEAAVNIKFRKSDREKTLDMLKKKQERGILK